MFGFCAWDIPAAILLVVVVALYILRRQRLKSKCEAYERKLKEKEEAQQE